MISNYYSEYPRFPNRKSGVFTLFYLRLLRAVADAAEVAD